MIQKHAYLNEVKDRIIVALDMSSLEKAEPLVYELTPYVGYFKVGLQLITSVGTPNAVKFLHGLHCKVFLDGKFCDIPNTVGEAAAEASSLRVAMFNVHASAGVKAMQAAVKNKKSSLVLAVTVLTSLDNDDALYIFGASIKTQVFQFALDAKEAGVDGLICSPQELEFLSQEKELDSLLKITPGVRPRWAATNDQKRIMTPGEAILAGADMVVIGRPITNPPQEIGTPAQAAQLIYEEIELALEKRRNPHG